MANFANLIEESKPPDTGESPTLGASRIRQLKNALLERLSFLYGFAASDGELDATKLGAKWIPFNNQGSDPAAVSGQIILFAKTVSSKVELHAKDADGNVIQLTTAGKLKESVVTGIIVMWGGTVATIPSGWALCDGTGGTPDLRDKFIVGAKQDDAGVAKTNVTGTLTQSGGSVTHDHGAATGSHVLTIAEIPAHTHSYDSLSGGSSVGNGGFSNVNPGGATTGSSGGGGGHTHTISSVTHLPPYYALAFIRKA